MYTTLKKAHFPFLRYETLSVLAKIMYTTLKHIPHYHPQSDFRTGYRLVEQRQHGCDN